jgi:ribonuclease HI
MKSNILIYTDGASRGNPGPGGWGAVVLAGGYAMELGGSSKHATNNQMELEGALQMLSDSGAKSSKDPITLYSDSAYVVNGLNSWIYGWEKKGWVTMQKTKVENKETWIKLLELMNFYGKRLSIKKVSGHSGELYNERCDEIAVASALGKKIELFKGTTLDYDEFLKKIGTKAKEGKKKKNENKGKIAYSYVSSVGGKVYMDSNWADCEKRVKGKKGAKYKKVFSKEEETNLVNLYKKSK